MTLVEVVIYIALLSYLLAGFMQFMYDMNLNYIHLIHEIHDAEKA